MRTNNTQIFERDPSTNKIAATVQKYFHNGLAEKILSRKNPGTTFCLFCTKAQKSLLTPIFSFGLIKERQFLLLPLIRISEIKILAVNSWP